MNPNTFELDIDIKQPTYVTEPVVKQHDDVTLVINITDNDVPLDLTGVTTPTLSVARPDRVTVTSDGEKTGANQITFKLPRASVAIIGRSDATVQLYGTDKRVSSFTFPMKVEKDPSSGLNVTDGEKTLIEKVLVDGPEVIQAAESATTEAINATNETKQVAAENKTRFLDAVDTVANRDTTYPNPQHGDTVRVTGDSATYRYENGTGWVKTDQYNPTAIDEVTQQLADNQHEVNLLTREKTVQQKLQTIGNIFSTGLEPVVTLLQGDSTGNGIDEWYYLAMDWLSLKYPSHSFVYRLWDDVTQSYSAPTTVREGSKGDAYVVLTGVTGNYLSTPHNEKQIITGDMDIIAKISADDWVRAGASQCIVSKFGGAGNRGWYLGLDNAGRPYFWWSSDGTVNTTAVSTVPISIADGEAIWILCRVDVDNGSGNMSVKFSTSVDGFSWTLLGGEVVITGTSLIFPTTAPIEIGARGNGMADHFKGKIYNVQVKNGHAGKLILSPDMGNVSLSKTNFNDAEGNLWTLNGALQKGGSPNLMVLNASKPGATLAYSDDDARFARQTPIKPNLSFISYGHNEGLKTEYKAEYQSYIDKLVTKHPNTLIVAVTQNPQFAPNPYPENHVIRNEQIYEIALSKGYGLVDAYHEFIKTGIAQYLTDDGTHPNINGSNLWGNVAMNFLKDIAK
ncbi:GDSL-type esterase/lipase family protein [Sporosarcina sp. OR05]|uniref:GDSL-type esterase/lipase family protein n=1 Tax=Sporosarcina sp. OR05 TaxID=2969819 RepID=UPI00352A4E58